MIAIAHVRDGFEGDIYRDVRPGGQSLRQLVLSVPGLPEAFAAHGTVMLNGEPVPKLYWARGQGPELRPKPREGRQDIVTLHFAPQDGGSGGKKSLLALVASIALVAVGAFITGGGAALALGGSTLFGSGSLSAQALAGAIGVLGRLAIAQLSQPAARPREEGPSQLGSAGADANSLAPMQSGMRVCGTLKVFPPMVTLPLVELVGQDEFLEASYFLEGLHQIGDVRVGGVAAAEIDGLQMAVARGDETTRPRLIYRFGNQKTPNVELVAHKRKNDTDDWPALLYDQTTPVNSLPRWHTEATRRDPDEIWLQYIWPAGLTRGDELQLVMPLRLRMRTVGASWWLNLPELHFSYNSSQKFSKRVHLVWGAPPAITDQPDEQGAWQSYHSVPPWVVSGGSVDVGPNNGWTAHAGFNGGAGKNQVLRVKRDESGFTIWLDPAVFPRGYRWEVAMMRGAIFSADKYLDTNQPFNPATYGAGLAIGNLFGYLPVGTGPKYFTANGNSGIFKPATTESCLLLRMASVWHQVPLPATADAGIELKAKNLNIGQVSCLASGLVPVFPGGVYGGVGASGNPADHLLHALTGAQTPPEDRLANAQIDYAEIFAWRALCQARDHQIAAAFNGQDWKDVLNAIAGAGRAKLRQAAKWGVVSERDTSAEQPRMMFTPRNANNISLFKSFERAPDGFRISYRERSLDWEQEDRLVLRPGVSLAQATHIIAMDAVGIDRAAQIDDIFTRLLTAAFARDYTISFDTWFESLAAKRGDLVSLNHILLSRYHRSARILSVETNGAGEATALRLDGEVGSDGSGPYSAGALACAITLARGQVKTYALAALDAADPQRLALGAPAPAGEIQPDLMCAVGEAASVTERVLITDVSPTSDFEARITCVPEAPPVNA